jgi:ketosteroid isomerase-like protein
MRDMQGSQAEIVAVEHAFTAAIVTNDAQAVAEVTADDWVIIDSDGNVIDRGRFLEVIRSGALTHRSMRSEDVRIRLYGDAAVLTALTSTEGAYMGQPFTNIERTTDVFTRPDGRWRCVLTHLTTYGKRETKA